MQLARLKFFCKKGNCNKRAACTVLPRCYEYYNGLNEHAYWRIFIDQQSDVAVRTKITEKLHTTLKKIFL